uniref:Uncharacterized protein n=1 Tax=Arundo donax TaxID=35708 RepID=A0A0A9GHS5_ARUDO
MTLMCLILYRKGIAGQLNSVTPPIMTLKCLYKRKTVITTILREHYQSK